MTIPRSPTKPGLFLALLGGAVATAIGACSYDWSVGAAPVDAGGLDATIPDAGSPDVVISPDAPPDSAPPPSEAAAAEAQAPDAAGTLCAQLQATLDKDRKAAKVCAGTASGQCATWVTDECGCHSYVADAGSPAANAFAAELGAFLDAGCTPQCDAGGCYLTAGFCYATGACFP